MANYYMLGGDGKEYGPVSAEQLRQWAIEGRANAQTKVRTSDGVGYTALGAVSELTTVSALPLGIPAPRPASAPVTQFFSQAQSSEDTDITAQTKRLAAIVASGGVWMKLLALAMFLLAVPLCISIVGLTIAWLPLWQGINLWSAANLAKQAVYTGSENELLLALIKVRRSFTIAFFLIVALVFFYIIAAAIVLMSGGMSSLQGLGGAGGL